MITDKYLKTVIENLNGMSKEELEVLLEDVGSVKTTDTLKTVDESISEDLRRVLMGGQEAWAVVNQDGEVFVNEVKQLSVYADKESAQEIADAFNGTVWAKYKGLRFRAEKVAISGSKI